MAHYGSLKNEGLSEGVNHILGASVATVDGEKVG
jgi:hypothetical protein